MIDKTMEKVRMAKVRVGDLGNSEIGAPDLPAERTSLGVVTRVVFGGPRDKIFSRLHTVPAGETVAWSGSTTGYLGYVWEGAVRAGDVRLPKGSAIVVEHGSSAEISGEDEGGTLLVFNVNAALGEAPKRAGGRVHLLPAERVPRGKLVEEPGIATGVFADSACPTCELWLHENTFFDANYTIAPHCHSEDEVIVVIGGEIVLGRRRCGRGTALLIAKDTIYSFATGANGLQFINFRPFAATFDQLGTDLSINEQEFYLEKLGHPDYIDMTESD